MFDNNYRNASSVICLLISSLLVLPGCSDNSYNQFFSDESQTVTGSSAGLDIFDSGGEAIEDDCSSIANLNDGSIVVDIQVDEVSPERLIERYNEIEIDVSIGRTQDGLIVADTIGVKVSEPGMYQLSMGIKNSDILSADRTDVTIIAITRYLDYQGNLAVKMGRKLVNCSITGTSTSSVGTQ